MRLGTPFCKERPQDEAQPAPMRLSPPPHRLLRATREERGLSLQEVADACGINIRQYQKFESGERDVRGCAFLLGLRICKALDLDPWLFAQDPGEVPAGRQAGRAEGLPEPCGDEPIAYRLE